jgi:hypothetical protein
MKKHSSFQSDVQRFLLTARPARNHTLYQRWETAKICVFVRGTDKHAALNKLNDILSARRWELLWIERHDLLIEDRLREEGGEVWAAYESAQKDSYHVSEFPEHFAAGSRERPSVPPRLNESVVDAMITDAGGRRLTEEERGIDEENADYLLDGHVFELKELREEVFDDDKVERQRKLASLLIPYHPSDSEIQIDQAVLTAEDTQIFNDLVGAPIKNAVKKAASQIRATKTKLGLSDWRGGLILVNSGSFTMSAERCFALAKRYCSKDTRQIHDVICITQSFNTNSFDHQVSSIFLPREPRSSVAERLFVGWKKQLFVLMNNWMSHGMRNATDPMDPPVPIQFLAEGRVFSWAPVLPASSWLRHSDN